MQQQSQIATVISGIQSGKQDIKQKRTCKTHPAGLKQATSHEAVGNISEGTLTRHNTKPLTFYPGNQVRIWDHRQKRNSKPAVGESPIPGQDKAIKTNIHIGREEISRSQ
jgi:hypothetical protein